MKSSLEKIEGQARRLGYNVFYEFNKSTNEVNVVLVDKNKGYDVSKQSDVDKIK